MLNEIHIRNYLFVPDQRLSFGPGMTVLSGETGAGKSILVGSISLIFGETPPGLEAFDPEQPIYLEASFDLVQSSEVRAYLAEQGHAIEDEDLILAREINPQGRSTYFLNGRKVSSSLMRELKPLLVDFHHQRDQQRLLSPAAQLQVLDVYAQNQALKDEFAILYRTLRQDLKSLAELQATQENNLQLSELYQYQFNELEKANLRVGEDLELQQEFDLLSHAQEIFEAAQAADYQLYDADESAHSRIGQAMATISRYTGINQRLAEIEQQLRESLESIADAAAALGDLTQNLVPDPERLEEIRLRLDLINGLLFKHKAADIQALLAIFAEREAQINSFADLEAQIDATQRQLELNYEKLRSTGDKLSSARQHAAEKLARELRDNIRQLSVPEAEFKIRVDKITDNIFTLPKYLESCSENGPDACLFYFSANRGSDLKPLSAVVSGGELSRILLAVKKVLAGRIEPKLMILDEIDAGIGGKTADVVAQFIFELARRNRIICITHLAQIAAIAHQQIALTKVSGKQRNVVQMVPLDADQRLRELARMLSGEISGISLRHAAELIDKYKET